MITAASASVGVLFKLLREELDRLLVSKVEAPDLPLSSHGTTAINAVVQLLAQEERDMVEM